MGRWLRRARGVLVSGLIWAGGGFAIGGVIELLANVAPGAVPFASRVDMWPQTLAIPGFIGGVLFAVVFMIVGSQRRLDDLSMPMFAALGAVAGVLLGGIAMTIGAPLAFVALTTATGAVAGSLSLVLSRIGGRFKSLDAGVGAPRLRAERNEEAP